MPKPAAKTNAPGALEQAGLEDRLFRSKSLRIEEICAIAYLRVHSLMDNPFTNTGTFQFPGETGMCTGDNPEVLCLRPRDWLLSIETGQAEELQHQLSAETDPSETAVLNASDSLATFRLSGSAVPWLLSKLSGVDFLGGTHGVPHCAQTKMGHVAVIVHYHQVDGGVFTYDLILDRSIARYLWLLLIESASHAEELAAEYGR